MSEAKKQLDEKIAEYAKAKEHLDNLKDSLSDFFYENRKELRKEFLQEFHETTEKMYGKEYADDQIKRLCQKELYFCNSCFEAKFGFCHCDSDS